MKLKLTWLLTLFMAFVMQFSFAQEKTVTGTVTTASDGLPLPGASVIVKGTSRGQQTDFDGKFAIKVNQGDVLVISYVGMVDAEVKIAGASTYDVTLESDSTLDEVIVVAYGTQTKESLVGAVELVDSEIISKTQATSVTAALQGNVTGVSVLTSGGVPGENPTIRIRGVGSVIASADPLIIVDGSPFNGNLNSISQDQVESLTVLKDASSTSLYGSRGSNGVVVITTKSGKKDSKPVIELNTSFGVSDNAVDFQDVLGSEEWMKYAWEAARNREQYVNGLSASDAATFASANLISSIGYNPYDTANPVGTDGNIVPGANLLWDTDWLDVLTRPTGNRTNHGLNVSGGDDKTTYFFSVDYLKEEGNVKTTAYERVTSRLRVDSQITDWLKVGGNMFYSTSNSNVPTQSGSSFQSAIQWAYSVSSIYPVYRRDTDGGFIFDADGGLIFDYGQNVQSVNGSRPVLSGENAFGALSNYVVKNRRYNTTLNGYAEIDITKNLKFKTQLSYEHYIFDDYQYSSIEFGNAAGVGGRVSQSRDFTTTINAIQSLNYSKEFGDHTLSADVLYEAYQLEFDELSAQSTGYLEGVTVQDGSTVPEGVGGNLSRETLNGVLGRLRYDYDNKYFVEGSYRRDGSSRFSESVRWGDFFSVGGSWIISNEKFLENSSVVSNLKLRGSYGELGNNRGIGYFPSVFAFTAGWPNLDNPGVLVGGAVDPFLTWEKTASTNIGLDFALFDYKITGSIDYFDRESIDLLYNTPLPGSTGNTSVTTNAGSVVNNGIEVTLNANIINKEDFNLSVGANATFYNDYGVITEMPEEFFINGTKRWEEGRSIYDFYMREWAGVDPADGYGMWYVDEVDAVSGEVTGRTTTKQYDEATRYYADKTSRPDVEGAFNTNIRYKNWDFRALVVYSIGSYVYDSEYAGLMSGFNNFGGQGHADLADRWQQPGDITDVPLLIQSNNNFASTSTRFLFANDFARLKSLTLGYNFSPQLVKDMGISSLRLYLQGDNLFTAQSHEGIDPEQSLAGTTDSRSSLNKTYSFGLSLKF
ncbi:SusC/RagA family TonB-linked outer membrane protein [Winogradskyella sp. 4-2091]|uniref:SusC/RagA family TonB-linked outer membrane protein n=1 Tax=Winogradskyella sp. 4-2091 TaxID=3381659 RepID=UPI003892A5FB